MSEPQRVHAGTAITLALLAGIGAAWISAGSTGLLAHPLRHVLTWLALGTSALAARPEPGATARRTLGLLFGVGAVVAITLPTDPSVNALAAPVALALLAGGARGTRRRVLASGAVAAAVFALYRLMYMSVPAVWMTANACGRLISAAIGAAAGGPLVLGATFSGMDFLVLSSAWYAAWLSGTAPPRKWRAVFGVLAIALAHTGYLVLVASAADIIEALPKLPAGETVPVWLRTLRCALPWNLPVAGAALHLLVVAGMTRWGAWQDSGIKQTAQTKHGRGALHTVLAIAAAALVCTSTALYIGPATLEDKKVVIFKEGFLNWLKPEHGEYGRLSIGMYGLLPHFIESLGGQCVVSPDLSAEDLEGADVLMLIYPNDPWKEGQLERILDYVRGGGRLWLFGEHTVREKDGQARFNDVLAPTSMEVQFDSATFAVGGWLQTYDALAHPTTLGVPDERNQFGLVIGASVKARWPARPVLVGRMGWSDWGDEAGNAMMGDHTYGPGEQLGDLVLVAEQKLGKGLVLLFGDTSGISNGINMGAYPFNSRTLAYLANRTAGSGVPWRSVAALVGAALMLVLFGIAKTHCAVPLACVLLAALRVACTDVTHRSTFLVPDVSRTEGYDLAYIDSSHLGVFTGESWRPDGLMGLSLNLMRNGYLVLSMPSFSLERLRAADMLVSVAPMRKYSHRERKAIMGFVRNGGILLTTVGYDERHPSSQLLADFGFGIGDGTRAEGMETGPVPMGHFKSPYYDTGKYMTYVRFHAAWPIRCEDPDARDIAYGAGDKPVIMMRRVGEGKVVVIGDTCFAMNKNLEVESGYSFEGMRENPHFWRWFISYLRDEPLWVPPDPKADLEPADDAGAEERE